MKINVVIIGLGNIGRRHLQAVGRLASCRHVLGYNITQRAFEAIPKFCQDNNIPELPLELTDKIERVQEVINDKTIVIISSTAKGRVETFKHVLPYRPMAIIAEKPLCQSLKEYDRIIKLQKKYSVPIYLNFCRHLFPCYEEICQSVKNNHLKSFHASTWGGVACAGIHVLELMTWLSEAKKFRFLTSSLEDTYESRREGFVDFIGEMSFMLDEKVHCYLRVGKNKGLDFYHITEKEQQHLVYEAQHKMISTDTNTHWNIQDIEILYVSQLTDRVIKQIVERKKVALPDIEESYLAHKILFEYLKRSKVKGVYFT